MTVKKLLVLSCMACFILSVAVGCSGGSTTKVTTTGSGGTSVKETATKDTTKDKDKDAK